MNDIGVDCLIQAGFVTFAAIVGLAISHSSGGDAFPTMAVVLIFEELIALYVLRRKRVKHARPRKLR